MKLVSLFSGAGGADLGFEGFDIVFANEVNDDAADTYEENLDTPVWRYPIERTPSDMIPDCDVVIGGPPCTSFSNAKAGRGQRDMSGLRLVKEMQRVVVDKQPKVFIAENAPTLLDPSMQLAAHCFKHGWPGYEVRFYKLNAEDFGIPQQRIRFFIIGIRRDLYEKGFRFRPKATRTFSGGWGDYLGIEEHGILCRRGSSLQGRLPYQPAFTVVSAELPVIRFSCGTAYKGKISSFSRDVKGVRQRYLTLAELKMLQGFPKWYKFIGPKDSVMRQIGNAWCVNVSRALGSQLMEVLNDW